MLVDLGTLRVEGREAETMPRRTGLMRSVISPCAGAARRV